MANLLGKGKNDQVVPDRCQLAQRVTTFFYPDFTVGSGFSPDLLSPEQESFRPLAGLSDHSESPPVGNCSEFVTFTNSPRTLP